MTKANDICVRPSPPSTQDKAVSVLRLKDGEDPPLPDPKLAGLDGGGGISVSASGRPQRKSRARGGTAPFMVICCSDETVGFFKLKVRNQFGGCVVLSHRGFQEAALCIVAP